MLHAPSLFYVLTIVLLLPSTAWAYFDPITGSIVYQAVVAVVTGVAYVFRRTIVRLFKGSPKETNVIRPPTESDDSLPTSDERESA